MEGFRFLKGKKEIHPTTGITLEYLEKSSAVCFVLFNETKEKVILVKQYRPGVKGETWEVPAGLIDKGENQKDAAFRELREETGYSLDDIVEIDGLEEGIYASPAYTTEQLHFFYGRLKSDSTVAKELMLDDGEDIESEWFNIDDILKISNDMKTLFSVLCFSQLKR